MLFLDEPTSGLDTFTAYCTPSLLFPGLIETVRSAVVKILKTVASHGRTVGQLRNCTSRTHFLAIQRSCDNSPAVVRHFPLIR